MTTHSLAAALRRRLWRAPRLLTAYFVCSNVRRSVAGHWALAGVAAWIAWWACVSAALQTRHAAALATIAWLREYSVVLAGVCAVAADTLVSRRRAANRDEMLRSWTAALPVDAAAARWQRFAIETVPALQLAGLITVIVGGASLVIASHAGIPNPLLAWAAMIGGLAAGAVAGCLLPVARHEQLPEGSRYVPHRRRSGTPLPVGSLAALGWWPVRQMFARARPKTVARALVPVMVLMPLGTAADAALLVLGVSAAIGALVLLVSAVLSASRAAARWLQPLPLEPHVLARKVALPALIAIGAALSGVFLSGGTDR